ncbi:hypothetical protein [Streptacidiphilus melanogenes]|nr:hypothetical protein [Streptacidiphilus melanogenes]
MAGNAGMRSVAVTYGTHTASEPNTARPTWTVPAFPAVVERILRTRQPH